MSYQFGHVDRDERIDYHGGEEPPEMLPPHWHLPRSLVAAAVAAVFAGSLWFAYHEGTKHAASGPASAGDQVPLLRADGQPVKVKPDRPGGMAIPDQDDPIYNRAAGAPPVERLQPPPEKPAPRPTAPPPATITPAPGPISAPQVAAAPVPALPAPGPLARPAAAKPPAAVKPAAVSTPIPQPASASGPVKIQLGSLRTPEAARDEWQRLKHENADLLGKLTAVAVRSEVPDKGTYYRVEVGPVGDHAAAERLCKALKERKLGCSIVR